MKRRAVNRLNVGVSGHILTLFSLPCLFFPIVRQILPNLINTGLFKADMCGHMLGPLFALKAAQGAAAVSIDVHF